MLEKAVLFFYLSLLDEASAKAASSEVAIQLKRKELSSAEFLSLIYRTHQKFFKNSKAIGAIFTSGTLVLPKNFDWSKWLAVHKKSDREDILALLFNRILNFSEAEVSAALKISEGAVRFRVARALRLVGEINV